MPFPQRVIPTRTDIEDVYQENTQNILQKTCVSNMIGVLEQLNKISIFASEIFSDILSVTDSNNNRIKSIGDRLKSIECRVEPTEQMFLINSPSYFYDNPYPGKEWQRKDPLRGLLFRRDRANKCVNRRRDEGLPLPDLSKLDRISVSGQCIKKYSDSNFFMNEWLEAEKKKMEEEKAKRREKKKKRKKRKRQGADKITSIEKWVYDPITGKKVKKKATEITVTKYELTDSNQAGLNVDFETSDKAAMDRISGMETSKVAMMATKKEQSKQIQKQQKKRQQKEKVDEIQQQEQEEEKQKQKPPPVPIGIGTGPPPVPSAAKPPPVPGSIINSGGNIGGPPPVPITIRTAAVIPPPVPQIKKKLTGAEMAALSRASAQNSGAYKSSPIPGSGASGGSGGRSPMVPSASSALLAGIRGGMKLKKATQVKREPKMEKRDLLLAALKKKGQGGLRKVAEEEKNVKKEEKVDNTIFAILNRRQFMADDSDTESASSWSESED